MATSESRRSRTVSPNSCLRPFDNYPLTGKPKKWIYTERIGALESSHTRRPGSRCRASLASAQSGARGQRSILDTIRTSCRVDPQNNMTLLICYTVVSHTLFQLCPNQLATQSDTPSVAVSGVGREQSWYRGLRCRDYVKCCRPTPLAFSPPAG